MSRRGLERDPPTIIETQSKIILIPESIKKI